MTAEAAFDAPSSAVVPSKRSAAASAVDLNPYAAPTRSGPAQEAPFGESFVLASRHSRLFARIVDNLLFLALAVAAYYASGAGEARGIPRSILTPALFACVFGQFVLQWWLIATTGQSLGKRLLGIKVVRADGSAVGFAHGVVFREWVPIALSFVPFAGSFVAFVDAVAIFGQRRRCLHDRYARTDVIVA